MYLNDYKRFKSTHRKYLELVGFNDHSLEEVLIPYTNLIDSTKSENEIARKISRPSKIIWSMKEPFRIFKDSYLTNLQDLFAK